MGSLIQKIRKLNENYEKIRIESASYSKGTKQLSVTFLMHRHFDQTDFLTLTQFFKAELPFAETKVQIKKIVCDENLVVSRVLECIAKECIPVKERVKAKDIKVTKVCDSCAKITICAESEVCSYMQCKDFFTILKEYLAGNFCEDFQFEYCSRCDEDVSHLLDDEKIDYNRIEVIPARFFKVNYVTRLFDDRTDDTAMYIADARERTGELVIAGKIIGKREKQTKGGKTFYILDLSDGTGRMSGTVFCTKATAPKMEKLQEGSEVIVFGVAEVVDSFHRFTIKSINLCEFPKDFVYQERESRKPPESYLVVRPSEIEGIAKQTDIFSLNEKLPECLMGKSLVVLDIETTGTAFTEDKITEIGAVRVEDGKIIEKFSTLINPGKRIPENIIELTGINDEMVADAPTFSEVAGDLYKFCYGSIIVAHNLAFDYTFIKNESKKCDYVYSNSGIDTVRFAREVLPNLSNHKLNTVCEHFGIEFLHHRAYNDALATAQMLIELIKIKGKMPEFDA